MTYRTFPILCLTALIVGQVYVSQARGNDIFASGQHEDTMLMFVGEKLDVLSIASRREESAWQAPAVAQVITKKEMREYGDNTVADVLKKVPGFYMAQKEWGTQPYLRGIPDSVLFLYDTVPLSSDLSKSFHPIDNDLSLAGVKRIEIIRGPGSVLWGPDAFAGIVNIVPMSGKDLSGVESEVMYGTPGDRRGFYLNMGYDIGRWDAFLSVSGQEGQLDDTLSNVVRFWGDGENAVDAEDRYGSEWPGNSRYIEASGRFSYENWLTVSARLADSRRAYAMIIEEDDLSWRETRDNPLAIIKVEAKKSIDHLSGIRMTGTYQQMKDEHQIIDQSFTQKESTVYGELIYDRSFLAGSGLFTGGISFREKQINDALIWNGYLPDYLKPENESLLPLPPDQSDYDTRLWSAFGQYSHRFGDMETWLGLRYDNHDSYKDKTSMSAGISWNPSEQWIVKLLYGTAYRTPFAKQLQENGTADPENIQSINLLAGWRPSDKWGAEICGFWSKIADHVMEDLYAGLSEPNEQEFTGLEIRGNYSPLETLDLSANLTLIHNRGPDETYYYNDYSEYPLGGGAEIPHYVKLNYPYGSGADTLFNFAGVWHPMDNLSLSAGLGYVSSGKLIYLRDADFSVSSGGSSVWLLDAASTVNDFLLPGMDLQVSAKNLTDENYETPGTYSAIEGEPLTVEIRLRKKW
ncbi:MAG: TonB-dependent receptor plug domain-containing protein [Desulfococcaceae bacterium]